MGVWVEVDERGPFLLDAERVHPLGSEFRCYEGLRERPVGKLDLECCIFFCLMLEVKGFGWVVGASNFQCRESDVEVLQNALGWKVLQVAFDSERCCELLRNAS